MKDEPERFRFILLIFRTGRIESNLYHGVTIMMTTLAPPQSGQPLRTLAETLVPAPIRSGIASAQVSGLLERWTWRSECRRKILEQAVPIAGGARVVTHEWSLRGKIALDPAVPGRMKDEPEPLRFILHLSSLIFPERAVRFLAE